VAESRRVNSGAQFITNGHHGPQCLLARGNRNGAGANEMSGIEFVVSEQSKLLDQARDDAIADAHRKAELYARAAGAKLGRVVSITEEGSSPPPRPMQAMRAGAVPVAPGEQTLRAVVTVSYELGP